MCSKIFSTRSFCIFASVLFFVGSSRAQCKDNIFCANILSATYSYEQSTSSDYLNGPFSVNDILTNGPKPWSIVKGGRFMIGGTGDYNGRVGIGVTDMQPLAKLHVATGTTILGGNTLISSDPALQKKWTTIPDNSTGSLWGLWLDKGVVATDYAITAPGNWADFVFDSTYKLRSLKEVEDFIRINKHLPGMPSEQKIKEGYTIHAINTGFMQKIEELTLYSIEQEKQIQQLQQKVDELAALLNELKGSKGK